MTLQLDCGKTGVETEDCSTGEKNGVTGAELGSMKSYLCCGKELKKEGDKNDELQESSTEMVSVAAGRKQR